MKRPSRLVEGSEAERQALIFAAIAAGYRSISFSDSGEAYVARYKGFFWWSPLSQDDQATKLSKRLGIERTTNEEIVLAAAAIGRSMRPVLISEATPKESVMTITRYAIEAESVCGRAFNCSDYEMENGERYQGLYLLGTAEEAQQEISDDIEAFEAEDMDDPEEFVTAVLISADGSIVDSFGADVLPDLSMQMSLTIDQLKASAKAYYDEQIARGHTPDGTLDLNGQVLDPEPAF